MGADNKRLCTLAKRRTLPCGSVNAHGNVQLNPLTAPVLQPTFCASFLVGHANQYMVGRCLGAQRMTRKNQYLPALVKFKTPSPTVNES